MEHDRIPLTLTEIFTAGGGAGRAVLSPDGETIAVSGPAPGGGSGIHLLTGASGADGPPTFRTSGGSQAWSPDGERLAYIAGGALHVATPGEAGRTLVEGVEGLRTPAWSPDSGTLAYYSTESGSQDIWLVAADGESVPMPLTREAAETDDSRFSPMWSPEGRWIAYISNRADWWHDDVWLVEVATGQAHQVSTSLMASSSPVWSPDGSSLVLMGTAKDEYWYEDLAYLYRIDLDQSGSVPRVVREAPIEMQVHATDAIMRFDPVLVRGRGARLLPVPAAGRVRPVVGPRLGRRSHARDEHRGLLVVPERDAGRKAGRLHA